MDEFAEITYLRYNCNRRIRGEMMKNDKKMFIVTIFMAVFVVHMNVASMEGGDAPVDYGKEAYKENNGNDGGDAVDVPDLLTDNPKQIDDALQENGPHSEEEGAFDPLETEVALRYNDANDAYYKKDYLAAIQGYTKVLRLDPGYLAAYYGRGNAYYYFKDYQKAVKDYSKILSVLPQDADIWYGRAISYYRLGQFREAVYDYDQVTALNAAHADAYYGRGVAYYQLGEYENALRDYGKALEIDEGRVEAYYGKGSAYYQMGNYREALICYDKITVLRPGDTTAALWRDKCERMLRQLGEAGEGDC